MFYHFSSLVSLSGLPISMPDMISLHEKDVPTITPGLDVDLVSKFNEGEAYIPVDIKACVKSVKLKILFYYLIIDSL